VSRKQGAPGVSMSFFQASRALQKSGQQMTINERSKRWHFFGGAEHNTSTDVLKLLFSQVIEDVVPEGGVSPATILTTFWRKKLGQEGSTGIPIVKLGWNQGTLVFFFP